MFHRLQERNDKVLFFLMSPGIKPNGDSVRSGLILRKSFFKKMHKARSPASAFPENAYTERCFEALLCDHLAEDINVSAKTQKVFFAINIRINT
jgi:hypothetical protein